MQAWYDIDQDQELVLDDETAVDQLLDRLATGPEPLVVSLFRSEDLAGDQLPDIEFWVGVGAVPGRGLIQCSDSVGLWVTRSDDATRTDTVFYNYMNTSHTFPAGSEIPLDQVRAAIREFSATGRRPSGVAWQRVDR
ncbi:Imm1 family immunity protein [Allokutzneria sp. A3M-2-11 16]|uniref:Imm1 family immunity protein n=1 Tax=Allokutzneria sp. A3M-2-11 16 TaxID=2962043 RepID=UPI0020B668EA|nr:Imm1 family immunity protein [Allokutzneria sp. A3M-2-11 16]MCP3802279.1 Imm1 family immunity protein [Allokutzneria sp. A3M-2-11 16]